MYKKAIKINLKKINYYRTTRDENFAGGIFRLSIVLLLNLAALSLKFEAYRLLYFRLTVAF